MENNPYLYEASQGTGSRGSGDKGGGKGIPDDVKNLPPDERLTRIRADGLQTTG